MLALPENYDDGFLWQGRLAPASDAGIQGLLASRRAEDPPLEEIERELTELPEVAIATPNVWNVMGLNQSDQLRPLQSADHYLVKLACALRPHRRQQSIEWARFSVTLSADASGAQPIAFDMHPASETKAIRRRVALAISPEVKFHEIGASVGGIETTFEYDELVPTITTYGVQSSQIAWEYELAKGMKLQGDKRMNLLAQAPAGSKGCMATFDLAADVRIARWVLPVRLLPRRESVRAAPLTRELW